jgi:hypothetical protein
MSTDKISLDGVPAASLKLLNEDVLVRPAALEEERASGLLVLNAPAQNFLGGAFYGEVVAVGPGRLVEQGPDPEEAEKALLEMAGPLVGQTLTKTSLEALATCMKAYLENRAAGRRVPTPWKPGDRVMVRQGFGPEVLLREGRHHIVGRGNSDYGHGVVAAWDPEHVHCFHLVDTRGDDMIARCACGAEWGDHETTENKTRLPACSECPPGPRLAEAVLGGKTMEIDIPSGAGPGAYEMKPVDDGREDV